jgi:hypothetical protein
MYNTLAIGSIYAKSQAPFVVDVVDIDWLHIVRGRLSDGEIL